MQCEKKLEVSERKIKKNNTKNKTEESMKFVRQKLWNEHFKNKKQEKKKNLIVLCLLSLPLLAILVYSFVKHDLNIGQ